MPSVATSAPQAAVIDTMCLTFIAVLLRSSDAADSVAAAAWTPDV